MQEVFLGGKNWQAVKMFTEKDEHGHQPEWPLWKSDVTRTDTRSIWYRRKKVKKPQSKEEIHFNAALLGLLVSGSTEEQCISTSITNKKKVICYFKHRVLLSLEFDNSVNALNKNMP